jgi:DNA-binding MarR family transcriptional regulator
MPEDKEWYDMAELASEWGVPTARVRMSVASLEAIKAITTRDKPGDRRIKQVSQSSIETVRIAVLGA